MKSGPAGSERPASQERQIPLFGTSLPADGRAPAPADGRAPAPADGRAPAPVPASPDAKARPGRSAETAIPVALLNARARELLESSFPPLWIAGEVSNWRRGPGGHCYFSLRDDAAQIDCVLFRGDARRLPLDPEEGMEVQAFGRVSLYEARGRYQLMVRRLQAGGEGLWRLAFERLRRKLAAEGLLDPDRRRPIPRFPARVGVVTSRSGAALRDVVTVIRRRAPWTDILLASCRVQGDGAGLEIARALRLVGSRPDVDLVILTRGGGSVEDLWCFNEEAVARAVAACPVPIISAVGHEVDLTIVDLVADLRAPTPSAAAEQAVPDGAELAYRLRRARERLVRGLRRRAERGALRARRAEERLLGGMARRLERWEAAVVRAGDRLDALSPLSALRRGYAVPLGDADEVLRRAGSFPAGRRFRLRVVDGSVRCVSEGPEPPGGEGGAAGDSGAAEGP